MFMMKVQILILLKLNNTFLKILVLGSLFLTACGGIVLPKDSVEVEVNDVNNNNLGSAKSQIYEVKNCTMAGSCFFEYSIEATITQEGENIAINENGCKVFFGLNKPKQDPSYDAKVAGDEFIYWLKDGENGKSIHVGKFSGLEDTNYDFWLYNEGKDIASCEYLINHLNDSFTNRLVYSNEKFGFKTVLLPNYRVEYLPMDEGITMKRTVDGPELSQIVTAEWETWPLSAKEGPDETPYEVVIGITAMKNLLEYKDLGAYVKAECADCTLEFFGDGVFVGEDKINFSERVYLLMSEDKETLYRVYLRLPRHRFKYNQKGFDEWVKTIELS